MERIDELLKMEEYNIYLYTNLSLDRLTELAKYFSEENIDLSNYFTLTKFSTKFCWNNIVLIIKKMEYPQKLRGLPYLFEFLKDINWPVFQESVSVIISFDKKDIISFMEECLHQAYLQEDGMWISGIYMVAQDMDIQASDFKDEKTFGLFQHGDF
ncbi:DUF5071 domain-containing protein [Lacrimispora amygdalina]|nr:DUF5071 domain-containing protein [Clostridium indicum]